MNQPKTDVGRDRPVQHRKRTMVCLVLLAFAAFLIVALWPKNVLVVSIFPETTPWKYQPPVPDRWIPHTWGWYWRGKEFLLGKRRSVRVQSRFIKIPNSNASMERMLALLPQPAYTNTEGLSVWMPEIEQLTNFTYVVLRDLGGAILSAPQMSSGDNMAGRLFTGRTIPIDGTYRDVGVSLDIWLRCREKATDLRARVSASEVADSLQLAIKTNLVVTGRYQIPHGQALLILKSGNVENAALAVSILPTWQ